MRRLFILIKNILLVPYKVLHNISTFSIIQESNIDKKASLGFMTRFYRSRIGKYSYIGTKTFVSDCNIGSFTSIGENCFIGGATHPVYWVSSSPIFHKWKNVFHENFAFHDFDIFSETKIGNDVWIGRGVYIKAGVTIGDGAVIGMGSVVTKDIPAYEIWAGNPARFIKKRFVDDIEVQLLSVKWWEKDDEDIKKMSKYFNNPDAFLNYLEEEK